MLVDSVSRLSILYNEQSANCKTIYWFHVNFNLRNSIELIIINPVNCDGKKNKFRGNRPKGNCHLKEIHECIEKIDHYSNDPEA